MRLEVGDDLRYEPRNVTAAEFIEGAKADLTEDRKPRVRAEVEPSAESFFLSSRAILRAVGVLLRNAFEASRDGAGVILLPDGTLRMTAYDRATGRALWDLGISPFSTEIKFVEGVKKL